MYDHHYSNWRHFPMSKWRWPDFQPAEIACKDGSLMVNERAMDMLQKLRDKIGRPFIVNSAYRPPAYNSKVGGAKRSRHLKALAFDISMANHDPAEFEAAAKEIGFKGIGHYPRQNFMHIDARNSEARWNKGGWFPDKSNRFDSALPPESDREAAGEAKGTLAGVGAAGGVMATTAPFWASLSSNAQILLVSGLIVAGLAALWIFRRQIAGFFAEEDDV